jgi:GT2 family glycosyltransferase
MSSAPADETRKASAPVPEKREPPALDVAIVSYRCEGLLRDCLASLRAFPPEREMSVVVVDNDSGDGTPEMVEREFPEVKLIRAPGNVGFSAANNIAARYTESPYVLVLNPDTRVTEGALERVARVLDERRRVGIAGAKLVLEDGTLDHAAKRGFPTPLGALAHFTGVGRRDDASDRLAQYRAPERGEDEAGSVDAVNGAFMMIRRAVLEDLGGFDEGYWMYMEDLDLCYRFDAEGWVTWYEPSAVVVHVKAGTSGPIRNAKLNRAFHYGMFRFYRKFYAPHRAPLVNGLVYLGIGAKLTVSLARGLFARAVGSGR